MTKTPDLIQEIAKQLNISVDSAKPLSESEHETLYATAYSLYEQGDFTAAGNLFTYLVLNAPFCDRSWRGLAATRQMQQDYQGSLHAWALTAILQEKDPLPHFHAAECYLSIGNNEEALNALNAAETLLTFSANNCELKDKIELLKRTYAART